MEKDKEANYCDDCSNMVVNIEHISDCDRGTTTRRRCLAKPFNDHYAKKSDNSRFMLCDDVRLQVGGNCSCFMEKTEKTKAEPDICVECGNIHDVCQVAQGWYCVSSIPGKCEQYGGKRVATEVAIQCWNRENEARGRSKIKNKEVEPSICVQCGSFHNVGRRVNGEYFVMCRQGCGRGQGCSFKIREEAIAYWEKRNVKEEEGHSICVRWEDEWPTEEGEYWFHGWLDHYEKKLEKKNLSLVKCTPISNGATYSTGGQFIYKEEGAEGKWLKAILPEHPKED